MPNTVNHPGAARANLSLGIAAVSAVFSLGGVSYAAGSLSTRVTANASKLEELRTVPEQLADIRARLDFLVNAEQRRQRLEDAHGR